MNANQSSLIPFNLSNEKLEDDNFVKNNNDSNEKEFFIEGFEDAKLIENYESDSDSDNEEKEENQESDENGDTIESFSNPLTKCPLTFGSKFSFAYTSASGNTSNCGMYGCRVAKVDGLYYGSPGNLGHGGKHPQTFQIVHGDKSGNVLVYGESFYLLNNNQNNYMNASTHMNGDKYYKAKEKKCYLKMIYML